jgi:hypothetical protein
MIELMMVEIDVEIVIDSALQGVGRAGYFFAVKKKKTSEMDARLDPHLKFSGQVDLLNC